MLPAGALAQDSGPTVREAESSDPAAGSPSGVIYELPLGRGRRDAAPKNGSGDSSGSLYRSENKFGSSSEVPGSKDSESSSTDDDDEDGALTSGTPPDSGDTSEWRTFGLVALILVVGTGIGVLAWRGRRRYSG